MNLKNLPFPVYGDPAWRGKCPQESTEQASFFNQLRLQHPSTWGLLGLHIRNEGKRHAAQMMQIRAGGGFVAGAADIVIPGRQTLVIEMKRRDHTKSKWVDGQVEYLTAAHNAGAFACVALGAAAAWEAFEDWAGREGSRR